MFQSARVNSQIFILTKGVNPVLEVGTVMSVGQPRMGQMAQPNQYPIPMVVDLVAQVGNDKRTLTGLPADKDIFDYQGNLVVSDNKDLMSNELKMLRQQHENIVASYEKSKELIGVFDGMLVSLNPEEAEKKRNEARIADLEAKYAEQVEMTRRQVEMNEQLMQQMQQFMSKLDAAPATPKKTKDNA